MLLLCLFVFIRRKRREKKHEQTILSIDIDPKFEFEMYDREFSKFQINRPLFDCCCCCCCCCLTYV